MNIQEQIDDYINSQPEPKRSEMWDLHQRITTRLMPGGKLWFSDGRNSENKVIANPTIGYGVHIIHYANGTSREYFKVGLLANSTGISIHILGIKDKTYLAQTFGKDLGKASVTGYCIKFKTLKNINIDVLEAAIIYGAEAQAEEAEATK